MSETVLPSAVSIFIVVSYVSVLCESWVVEVMRSCMERSVVERVEDSDGGEKKKKKKNRRRSNRRSKQNISSPSG